jgi:hypothetical protein
VGCRYAEQALKLTSRSTLSSIRSGGVEAFDEPIVGVGQHCMRFVATSGIAKNSPEARPIQSILQSFHDQVEKRHRQSHSEFAVSPRARRETGDRSLRRVEFQRVSVAMNALSIAPTAPIVSASKHRNQGRERELHMQPTLPDALTPECWLCLPSGCNPVCVQTQRLFQNYLQQLRSR